MKRIILSFILIFEVTICYSQGGKNETISKDSIQKIDLHFDMDKKDFKENLNAIKFKSGVTYQAHIYGINPVYVGVKIESESYTMSSTTPKIIEPFFLGVNESENVLPRPEPYFTFRATTDSIKVKGTLKDIYRRVIDEYNRLIILKSQSDSLYKHNIVKIDQAETDTIKKCIFDSLAVKNESIEELRRIVKQAVEYVGLAEEVFQTKIEKIDTEKLIKDSILVSYAEIRYISKEVKSDDFSRYIDFLENLLKPQRPITSKHFNAEKDLVDLNVVFVDNYKRDTLYNSPLTFYTSGNLSFDFSTGIFYNNLQEDSYYLEKRDSVVNNVLMNDNSDFDISFGALGHLSYKIKNNVKVGIGFGAALSPLDGKVRLLFGGSLLFGKNKQWGLTGGVIWAKMKVLSNSVKKDEIGEYVLADVTSVPTYDKIVRGYYLGFTYNLTRKRK